MKRFSRRAFVGGSVAAVAASALLAEPGRAQMVWQKGDWKYGDFDTLLRSSARVKQVFDCGEIAGGHFLRAVRNCLDGVQFGFGLPPEQIKLAIVLFGPANMANFNDHLWSKYRIGEWLKLEDPKTKQPAVRNIFYPGPAGPALHYASQDPDSPDSAALDSSMQGLQARGVQFMSCHFSVEATARALITRLHLSEKPEAVVSDFIANKQPGVLVVPSAAAAVAMLQNVGHYSHMGV